MKLFENEHEETRSEDEWQNLSKFQTVSKPYVNLFLLFINSSSSYAWVLKKRDYAGKYSLHLPVPLLWGSRLVSHAMCRDGLNLTRVSLYTVVPEEEPLLPGTRLAAPLRMLCGPGLSTKLQGLPAK